MLISNLTHMSTGQTTCIRDSICSYDLDAMSSYKHGQKKCTTWLNNKKSFPRNDLNKMNFHKRLTDRSLLNLHSINT